MEPAKKATLLNTSSGDDVKRSGGILTITGFLGVPVRNLKSIEHRVFRAETVQVVTLGSSGYTPAGSTTYKLAIYSPTEKREGFTAGARTYSYTSRS